MRRARERRSSSGRRCAPEPSRRSSITSSPPPPRKGRWGRHRLRSRGRVSTAGSARVACRVAPGRSSTRLQRTTLRPGRCYRNEVAGPRDVGKGPAYLVCCRPSLRRRHRAVVRAVTCPGSANPRRVGSHLIGRPRFRARRGEHRLLGQGLDAAGIKRAVVQAEGVQHRQHRQHPAGAGS